MADEVLREGGIPLLRPVSSPLYIFRGAGFLWRHRVLWKYAAAPLVIGAMILGVGYYLLYHFFFSMLDRVMGGEWYWQVLYYVLVVFVALFLVVVFFFLFTFLATAISAPFNDVISEKTEQLVTGRFQETPFSLLQLLKDSGRGIAHSLRILTIYLGLLVVCLLFLLIPGLGGPLFSAATLLLSAYVLAYEYLSYPMDRRRYSFKEKRRFLRSRFASVMGFGITAVALASVPVINIAVIPAAAVGGTLLFLDLNPPGPGPDRAPD